MKLFFFFVVFANQKKNSNTYKKDYADSTYQIKVGERFEKVFKTVPDGEKTN